jgi:hypothetical protein
VVGQPRRVNIYVDGFNLYYGCCKATPYKWLDLAALGAQLLPGQAVQDIRYFTAEVNLGPSDPGQIVRQETYIRALRTIPNLTIKKGFFLTKPSNKKRVYPLYGPDPRFLIRPIPLSRSGRSKRRVQTSTWRLRCC